ncbi:MAG TPA: NUDIX hydrolase [Bacteroidetes bacterium]|jgi:8-oxo-dGTP diphosphatase|nr:NUDIX hydrolase [Bacteroidota bacterium]
MVSKFNVRVYGIWIKEGKILVSNENINGFKMLKLPGGGLELGEGTKECLVREFKEELDVTVKIEQLLHVTENFIQSAFRKDEQIIAVHYRVSSADTIDNMHTVQPTKLGGDNIHLFEWRTLDQLLLTELTFDMDKQALAKLT